MHDDQQRKKIGSQICKEKKTRVRNACRLGRLQIRLGRSQSVHISLIPLCS
jgi:hypothetical protein